MKHEKWMEKKKDADGYQEGDNRAWNNKVISPEHRREVVRRSWNF